MTRPGPPVAIALADWSRGLDAVSLPGPVPATVTRHLLDGLGVTVAAARRHAAEPAVAVARGLGGPPQATILGVPERVGAPAAAFANGVQLHALDFDDTHAGGLVHATAGVLPAALAVAEETGASGAQLLAATVAGLETTCRLAAAAPNAFHARGLHVTSVCGVFAAALAAAKLYGLDTPQTGAALGIAASQAGGLLEFLNTGANTKQLHPGFAAHGGILAARLAAAGAQGPDTAIEGDRGLYAALLGRRVPASAVLDGLGERWELTRITVKPYPACQVIHASLDAARELRAKLPGPQAVTELVAQVHPDTEPLVCGAAKQRPQTEYEAKFSLPWSVAAFLIDGAVTVDTYDRIDRPDVLALAARIVHQVVDRGGVAADQPGELTARLNDGRTVTGAVPYSGGGPDTPHITETVRAKAVANLGGGPAAQRVVRLVDALSEQPSIATLVDALTETTIDDHRRD